MNWEIFGTVTEIVGVVVVVATLIYVAIQTRINAKLSAAQAPYWILEGSSNWFSSLRSDPEFTRLLRYALHHWSKMHLNDQVRVHAFYSEMMVHLDFVLELQKQNLVSESIAVAWADNALGVIITEGGAEWWESAQFFYSPIVRAELARRQAQPATLPSAWTAAPFYLLEDIDHEILSTKSQIND